MKIVVVSLTLVLAAISPVSAQNEAQLAPGGSWISARDSRVEALQRAITLSVTNAPLTDVLKRIARTAGVELAYGEEVSKSKRRVTLTAAPRTIASALMEVLEGTGLEAYVSVRGNAILVTGARLREPLQVGTIAGRVTDSTGNSGIDGVNITIDGMRLGAISGADGAFTIRGVPIGSHSVTARRLGYRSQSRLVVVADNATASADFVLVRAPATLAEIVVTPTGERRLIELGNTIAVVRADSLTQTASISSFGDLLQGRVAGVFSTITSNNVGQAGGIRVRGLNSFGVPNDPVVVLDGIRIEATPGTAAQSATAGLDGGSLTGGYTGRLADLDPNEIESIEVVKGPSAATLYGTDAANGVIVVTTKRGRTGPARWSVFTQQGLLQQKLDDWAAPWGGGPHYAFGHSVATGVAQRCTLLQRGAGSCVLDSLVSFNAFTNPDTRPFKNGYYGQAGLQVSGGALGATYFLRGGYENEIGTPHMPAADQAFLLARRGVNSLPDWQVRPNTYERLNVRANFSAPFAERGTVTLSTGFIASKARQPAAPPFFQVGYRDPNGGWLGGVANQRPAYTFASVGHDLTRRFVASLATNYAVSDALTLRGTIGTDLFATSFGRLTRRGEGSPGSPVLANGFRTANELDVALYSVDLGITGSRALAARWISRTSLGMQYNRRGHRGLNITASNLPLGGQTIAGAANPLTATEVMITSAVGGAYVEELIGFQDRLFLTAALRLDGASAFGKDFSVISYPKLGASWLLSDHGTGVRLPGVSSLRLRSAYGVSGVQPGPVAALQRIALITGISGTAAAPAAHLGQLGNPDLRAERTTELEAGADIEFARPEIRVEYTAYRRTSRDALITRTLSPDVGGSSRWENIGSVRNDGMELTVDAQLLRNQSFSGRIAITGSLNKNRLLRLGDGVVVSSFTLQGARQEIGYPLFGLWGQTVASFADANANGIIEPSEIVLTPNHYIGSNFPTKSATIAPSVGAFAERLRLSALLEYRGGLYTANSQSGNTCRSTDLSCRAVNDISTPPAEQARSVAYSVLNAFGDYWEPSSYLEFRELSATFVIPTRWVKSMGAAEGQVAFAGRNLALLRREGSAAAPESGLTSTDQTTVFQAGKPTYWLMRISLTY